MRKPAGQRRLLSLLLPPALVWVQLPGALARGAPSVGGAPPAAVLQEVTCSKEIPWYLQTDIGLLHVNCDGRLRTLDLFDGGRPLGAPIPVEGAERIGSVLHISGTRWLLVTSASALPPGAKGTEGENPAAVAATGRRPRGKAVFSFLLDALSGEVLWSAEALPFPVAVFNFPDQKVLCLRGGRRGDQLTAIDLASGHVLWRDSVEGIVAPVYPVGDYLYVLGPRTRAIEVSSGRAVWTAGLPFKFNKVWKKALMLPDDRVVVLDKKKLEMFALPPLPEEASGGGAPRAAGQARSLWKVRLDDAMFVPRFLPPSRILLGSMTGTYEMVDAAAGRHLWKKDLAAGWASEAGPGLVPSPSGRYGAVYLRSKLHLVDLDTGEEIAKYALATEKHSSGRGYVEWLDENEVLVVSTDGEAVRFDVPGKRTVWAHSLGKAADYELTARQRGAVAASIFASVLLVAAGTAVLMSGMTAAAPGVITYTPASQAMSNALLQGAGAAMTAGGQAAIPRPGGLPSMGSAEAGRTADIARQRCEERARRYDALVRRERIALTGGSDTYDIVSLHRDDGHVAILARHVAPRVHGITPEVPFGVMVSIEENKKLIRVLSVPGADAPPVDPSLLPGLAPAR